MVRHQLRKDLKSPWLRSILGFMLVVIIVNGGFITYAFLHKPNLVVADYYEKGQRYFHDQKIRHQQQLTAWHLQLLLPDKPRVNTPVASRLYVVNHKNKAVETGRVLLNVYRPSDTNQDFKIVMKRVDHGTFLANIVFPQPGIWDLIARIDSQNKHFDTAARVFVEK